MTGSADRAPMAHSPLHHDPEALRYALDNSGLSQVAFGAALNPPRSQGYVSEILAGTRNARPALLQDMARVLNCPVVVLQSKRPDALVALIDERIAAAFITERARALEVYEQGKADAAASSPTLTEAQRRNLRRLAERKTFPSRYLRDLVGVGVDERRFTGPRVPESGQLGESADDNGHAGERAGELHAVVGRVVGLVEHTLHHTARAAECLEQIVVALLVEVDVDDVAHGLAPSSLAGTESVGASSASGSASSAEDDRPDGAQ